ncbi:NTP transferase domain-containing protein [Anaerovibrio sp.]|uniref:NTP transferase domain-containing protein n=1 Tax=Anaerovibrio sp. TaxID=1872532 RepID=UPI0025B8575B|nr:NTP transferase domain-containing protein [Anaerovibrio sp.]MBR2142007.1 NTP transferase domain-containing protein [Anaerovibrio sp.]
MQTAKSVVITCAGIGSRLGLGTTKALIDINGKSLIHWQLDLFQDVEDIRIVVGFEANRVIEEVRKYRPDAIFVYNHDYFNTKTGTSYYLGAKDGKEYAMEYDGDLLVHPDDVKMLLAKDGEWIAYADKRSEDAVYLSLNEQGEVTGFSRDNGDYEWTGPCCLHRDKIQYTSGNVFNVLEPYIPLPGVKIRACDIDTYGDYQKAIEFIKEWK